MGLTTLSHDFQLRIPASVRDAQNWKPGQKFAVLPKGKGILLMPVPEIEDLRGIAAGADTDGYRDRS